MTPQIQADRPSRLELHLGGTLKVSCPIHQGRQLLKVTFKSPVPVQHLSEEVCYETDMIEALSFLIHSQMSAGVDAEETIGSDMAVVSLKTGRVLARWGTGAAANADRRRENVQLALKLLMTV